MKYKIFFYKTNLFHEVFETLKKIFSLSGPGAEMLLRVVKVTDFLMNGFMNKKLIHCLLF